MALTNWPPASNLYPAWPPPQWPGMQCDSWATLKAMLEEQGFSHAAPTPQERSTFFNATRCGDGHTVLGRMLVSPDGAKRWPFCVCTNAADREFLVLWPPYTCGWSSGPSTF